jgi:NTP pyrophosphatase (non-canonical NTP hydrolase)
MEPGYLDDLRLAYDRFFAEYTEAPVLTLDTDNLDIVQDVDARSEVIAKVKTALRVDNYQLSLPTLDDLAAEPLPATDGRRRLGDFQRFHRVLDQEKGFIADLFLDYICLTEEVGEIGRELKHAWVRREQMLTQVGNREEANDRALETVKDNLQEELADALAFLLKIANDTGIDLETAYLKKMGKNWTRSWVR